MDQIWQIIMLLILLEFVKVKPQSTEMFCKTKNNRPRQR